MSLLVQFDFASAWFGAVEAGSTRIDGIPQPHTPSLGHRSRVLYITAAFIHLLDEQRQQAIAKAVKEPPTHTVSTVEVGANASSVDDGENGGDSEHKEVTEDDTEDIEAIAADVDSPTCLPSAPEQDPGSEAMTYLCRTIRVLLSAWVEPSIHVPKRRDDAGSRSNIPTSGLEAHLPEIVDLLLGKDGWDLLPVHAWVAVLEVRARILAHHG